MKNNKTLLIVLLAFVAVLGGAYILYDRLSASVESRQLTAADIAELSAILEKAGGEKT